MKMFWVLFGIGLAMLLVVASFFLAGLGDGSVNAFNMAIWLPLVCVPAAVLAGGVWLNATGRPGMAKMTLALLAVPAGLLGVGFLVVMVLFATHPGAHH